MAGQEESSSEENPIAEDKTERRVQVVEESGVTRPYMRGIMVHSLMARGAGFDEAYEAANEVGRRLRGRGAVPRAEVAKIVREIVGEDYEHQPPIPVPITVKVLSKRSSSPFSKGALAQSLLAASLEPDDAFDVAREIELGLIRQGHEEIARAELRRRAYETVLRRFGRKSAERYMVWREYQDPEKPVIILLGGTSGAGKTSLALEVARRLGISRVLSTDSIRQIMRIMLSPELMPAIHYSSFEAHQAVPTMGADPGAEGDAVVQGFLAQAAVVSVGVKAIVDRAVEENASLVIEGASLVPGLTDLSEYSGRAHMFYQLVARLDEEAFRGHFEARAEQQKQRTAERYFESMDNIWKIQEHLLDVADLQGAPIIDNVTLDGSVLLVIRHVVETLRKQAPAKARGIA